MTPRLPTLVSLLGGVPRQRRGGCPPPCPVITSIEPGRKSAEVGNDVDQEGDNNGGDDTEDGKEGAFGEHSVFDRSEFPVHLGTQLRHLRFNSGEALLNVLGPLVNAAQSVFPGCVFGSGHNEHYTQSVVERQGVKHLMQEGFTQEQAEALAEERSIC